MSARPVACAAKTYASAPYEGRMRALDNLQLWLRHCIAQTVNDLEVCTQMTKSNIAHLLSKVTGAMVTLGSMVEGICD